LSAKVERLEDKEVSLHKYERAKIISIIKDVIGSEQSLKEGNIYENGYVKREIDSRLLSSEF
jgi:hypothetical protein